MELKEPPKKCILRRKANPSAEGGLTLGMRLHEFVKLETSDGPVYVTFCERRGSQIRINLKAPDSVKIHRSAYLAEAPEVING